MQDNDPVRYALFVSYFPHLIAGPILHHAEMIPQFQRTSNYRFSWENMAVGVTMFGTGLIKKVVFADGIAQFVPQGFDGAAHGGHIGLVQAWISALAYALQIYFDFSGYSDMAIGASKLIGIDLPINFNSPYKSTSIIEFWKRWHMTLSRFLRDYLYIPLGGNQRGEARRYLNLFVVMLLGGLWHGAGWTFILWGGLHGCYLVANHLWRSWRGSGQRVEEPVSIKILGGTITFLAVVIAWVLFRATNVSSAISMYQAMAGLQGWGENMTRSGPALMSCLLLTSIALFMPNSQEVMKRYVDPKAPVVSTGFQAWWHWRPSLLSALAFSSAVSVALFDVIYTHRVSDFLYFQF